nr:hypothetical protein [uncultured Oscillibacter sp.]
MEGYLKAPFKYAQEARVTTYLETLEYRRTVCDLEEKWEAFRSGLTAEQDQTLDALLEQERKVGYLEEGATFASGLSIGVSLGRL